MVLGQGENQSGTGSRPHQHPPSLKVSAQTTLQIILAQRSAIKACDMGAVN